MKGEKKEKFEKLKSRVLNELDSHAESLRNRDDESFAEGDGEIFRQIKLGQVKSFRRMINWAENELDEFIESYIDKSNPLYYRLFLELLDCQLNDVQNIMKKAAKEARLESNMEESDKNEAMISTLRALQLKMHSSYTDICGEIPKPLWKRFVWRR